MNFIGIAYNYFILSVLYEVTNGDKTTTETIVNVSDGNYSRDLLDTHGVIDTDLILNFNNSVMGDFTVVKSVSESLNISDSNIENSTTTTEVLATTHFLEQQITQTYSSHDLPLATTPINIVLEENTVMNDTTVDMADDNSTMQSATGSISDAGHKSSEHDPNAFKPMFDDVNQDNENVGQKPQGGHDQDLMTTGYSPSVNNNKIGYNSEHVESPVSIKSHLRLSIVTGVVLALIGVSILIAAVLIFKRQRQKIKQKLMMNFDLNRMDLRSLRHQPENILIIDFPLKAEVDTWHDVEPITSSVV